MNKITILVSGMTCKHCEQTIKNKLITMKDIQSVKTSFSSGTTEIYYKDNIPDIKEIEKIINENGYKYKGILNEGTKRSKFKEILPIILIILAIYLILKLVFNFDFLNFLPNVSKTTTIPVLFIIGLLTSIHCVGMCGSINLAISANSKSIKNPLLYNLGRVISYTLVGAVVGLIGSVFSFNSVVQGIIVLVASIFMILMGLSMIGWLPKSMFRLIPRLDLNIKRTNKTPFVVGLLNGLMPCGPLQTMQLYALSTGSMLLGALSMFVFSLGTIPLVFGFGVLFSSLNKKYNVIIQRISSVLIILLAIFMIGRAFNFMGINLNTNNKYSEYLIAEKIDNYQYVEIELKSNEYTPIIVQKGIPVKFNITVDDIEKYGCTSGVRIPEYKIIQPLRTGDNFIEFTPSETGEFIYTCWMGMVTSKIRVVDDLNNI